MTIRLATITLALAALVGGVALAGGGEPGDWELGLFAGYGFLDDYEGSSVTLNPDDDMLFGLRVGYFMDQRWSAEGSYQMLSSETENSVGPPDFDFDRNSIRFNLLHNFRPGETLRPFATVGVGLEKIDASPLLDRDNQGINVGGGVRWFKGDTFNLRFDARWVSTNVGGSVDHRQSDLEATVGASWIFGGAPPGDADGDGVKDGRDKCPDTPRGAVVDAHGCPIDSDGDGVADGIDKCPDTESGVPVDAKGCPRDSDGDGVHDGLDKCPDTPKGAIVDATGCPVDSDGDGVADGIDKCPDTPKGATVDAKGCPKDSDGDGVADGLDKCPDTPKGATVDAKGCPKDSDGDGVFDGIDKCPDTPAGTKVDAKGCTVLFEEGRETLVLRGVNFETDSADLTASSRSILDSVAASLKEWSEVRVEVAGHTDSVGAESYNQQLSQRRAESVRDYLAGKGVDKSRMTARGYGETHPVADNKTKEGRGENRRVELRKID
jgi:outer membrane protein OmpA-like peptidoglycan-associated protein